MIVANALLFIYKIRYIPSLLPISVRLVIDDNDPVSGSTYETNNAWKTIYGDTVYRKSVFFKGLLLSINPNFIDAIYPETSVDVKGESDIWTPDIWTPDIWTPDIWTPDIWTPGITVYKTVETGVQMSNFGNKVGHLDPRHLDPWYSNGDAQYGRFPKSYELETLTKLNPFLPFIFE